MFCHKCGREIPAGSQFCPGCGSKVIEPTQSAPLNKPEHVHQEPQPPENPTIRSGPAKFEEGVCPRCGSHDCEIQVQQNVTGSGSNYNVGMGCLGFLLTGPFGLLCGLCGAGSKTTTTHQSVWVCKKCGHQFRPREVIINGINVLAIFLGMILGFGICAIIWLALMEITIWQDVVNGFADVGQVFAYAGILFLVILGIVAVLCIPIFLGMQNIARGNGFTSIKEFLTPEELSGVEKRILIGIMPIVVIGVIVLL